MSKREEILTTAAADKMLGMISPIYDESYVGLWIMEVIGREYQRLADVVSELPEQMQPETATWLLEFWEQRYGITPPAGATIAQRRQAIAQMRILPQPLSPYRLEQYLETITGRKRASPRTLRHIRSGSPLPAATAMQR